MSEPRTRQPVVRLRADWGTGPLWMSKEDDLFDPYGADEIIEVLPLSADLRTAVAAWDERYQSTYNDAAPQESGIRDLAARAAFIACGWELAHRIRGEVPAGVVVRYVDVDGDEWDLE